MKAPLSDKVKKLIQDSQQGRTLVTEIRKSKHARPHNLTINKKSYSLKQLGLTTKDR